MLVAFRADASRTIGHGHIMRCLTLASALRQHGAQAFFICREHDGHLCDLVEERGFVVSRLPSPTPWIQAGDAPAHATWLASSWQEDAEQTRGAIETMGDKPEWLVVDHYGIDQQWEGALRGSMGRIFVIDDLADRCHDCDLLLDQNLVADMHDRYADKVPRACGMLLGPKYALLQPVYAELHDRVPPREGQIKRILIYFGGADNENLTGLALGAFLRLNRPDIEVDVIITGSGRHAAGIKEQTAGHDNIHIHVDLPTLAHLMAKADLAIGAGGATSWERLCLGLPSLVITLAENQKPVADELHRLDLVDWLGHKDQVEAGQIGISIRHLTNENLDGIWSRRCKKVLNGRGIDSIIDKMFESSPTYRMAN